MTLAVGHWDGYGVVGLGVGRVGRGASGRGPRRGPCGPVPAGPQGPAGPEGPAGSSRTTASPSARVVGPAGPRAGRAQQQQVWRSVRPSVRADRPVWPRQGPRLADSRLSAAAEIGRSATVRPSRRAGQPGSGRSRSPSVRVVGPGGPRSAAAAGPSPELASEVRPSVQPSCQSSPSVRVVRPARSDTVRVAGRQRAAAAGPQVRRSERAYARASLTLRHSVQPHLATALIRRQRSSVSSAHPSPAPIRRQRLSSAFEETRRPPVQPHLA